MTAWYDEALYTRWHDKGYAQRFRVDRVLFEDKSEHQHVLVFEPPDARQTVRDKVTR